MLTKQKLSQNSDLLNVLRPLIKSTATNENKKDNQEVNICNTPIERRSLLPNMGKDEPNLLINSLFGVQNDNMTGRDLD